MRGTPITAATSSTKADYEFKPMALRATRGSQEIRRALAQGAPNPLDMDVKANAIELATKKERAQVGIFELAAVTNTIALAAGYEWDNPAATSNPWADVDAVANLIFADTGIDKGDLTLVINRRIFGILQQHAKIQEAVKYQNNANSPDASKIADYFGIKEVLVCKSAFESITGTVTRLLTETAGLYFRSSLITPNENLNGAQVVNARWLHNEQVSGDLVYVRSEIDNMRDDQYVEDRDIIMPGGLHIQNADAMGSITNLLV
jgi:hypothetical protein